MLEYHARLIADDRRNEAFRAAIAATVRPGDVVVDVGTGTGLLALYAVQAGAGRVYAVERGEVADLAERVIAANGAADRVVLVRGDSSEIELPEPADVLISELLWAAGLGEGQLSIVQDARRRLLRSSARVVPCALRLVVAPVGGVRARRQLARWGDRSGVDLGAVRAVAANVPGPAPIDPAELVARPVELPDIPLTGVPPADIRGGGRVRAERTAEIDGLAVWFDAELAPGVRLSNPPGADLHWMQAQLPFERPLHVAEDDELELSLDVLADGDVWRWRIRSSDDERSQSSFQADLRTVADLRTTSPRRAPRPTEAMAAERFLLDRIDGTRTAAELAAELRARFGDVLRSDAHARRFVAAALARLT